MPNLSKCKTVKGKLYCWDSDLRSFVYVEIKPVTNKAEIIDITEAFVVENDKSKESNN